MKPVKATVGAIVHENHRILLELRNHDPFYNRWCIPGGHIEFGEPVEEALCREVKEETGLTVTEYRFFNYYTEYYKELDWHAVALIFVVRIEGDLLPQESEVQQLKWFSFDEVLSVPFAFEHKRIVEDFLSSINAG